MKYLRGRDEIPPTLEELYRWPPLITVADAAYALGWPRGLLDKAIKRGDFPAATVRVNSRVEVITESLIDLLSA